MSISSDIKTSEFPENNNFQTSGVSWVWHEHLPLIATGASAFLIVYRLLVISNFNFETAGSILQASGTGTIIVGTLIPSMGFLMVVAWYLMVISMVRRKIDKKYVALSIGMLIIVGIAALAVSPIIFLWTIPVGILEVIIFLSISIAWTEKKNGIDDRKESDSNGDHTEVRALARHKTTRVYEPAVINLATVMLLSAFIIAIINPNPWVPPEVIIAKGMAHPITGFVFNQSDTDITILTAKTQAIVHIPTVHLVSRTVCQPHLSEVERFLYQNIIQFLNNLAYPNCPGNNVSYYP